jgi:phage terminase large subunit-like protein
VARKAAKSTLAAAIGLYHLTSEGEPGASVICGATTGLQARMVFGIMQKMVRKSAYLSGLGLVVYANAITASDGSARPVNSKASTLDGLNPSCIILDEAHAQDFGLHDVLKSAQGARRNPLMICPTTAGYDLLSVGYALRSQLTKTLDGVYETDHFLGSIWTLDDEDDWRDARVWIKANPMIGVSPTFDYVQNYARDAQQSPQLAGEFLVKLCNRWAQSASTWLSITAWDKCADPALKLEDFLGAECWIASDLAALDDLAAIALVFRKGDLVIGFVRAYLPEGVVAERARTVPAYEVWRQQGRLITTEGTMTDFARIEADLRADCKRFNVKQLVFDQFGSYQIAGALAGSGLPAIIEPKNARTFTAPMRELEARVKYGRFRHDGDLMLKWAVSNGVVTRRTDDSLLLKKEHAESANKIDPLDALIQAIGAMLRGQATRPKEYTMIVLGGTKAATA